MKVIFAGFSKTGTKTINTALTELGYNVYDFVDHFWYHDKYWSKIFKDGGTVADFQEMYKDVDAVVDMPAFLFWEEISEAFPDAKIIFTIRDEEAWTESACKQLDITKSKSLFAYIVGSLLPTSRGITNFFKKIMPFAFGLEFSSLWTGMQPNKMLMRKRYQQYNTYFLQNSPKDKVLMFDLKDGWKPLCEFLGKQIPETPFPWRNKAGQDELLSVVDNHACGKQMQKEFLTISCLITIFLGISIYFYCF